MAQHLTVARIAEALDVSWDTANDAVLAEGRRLLIDDPARFDGVAVTGTDLLTGATADGELALPAGRVAVVRVE